MSIASSLFTSKMNQLGGNAAMFYAKYDPEGFSDAQMIEENNHVAQIAARVAEAESKAQHDAKIVTDKTVARDRDMSAANILGARLTKAKSDNDAVTAAAVSSSLTKLLSDIKQINADLELATKDAAESSKDALDWHDVHNEAVEKLTGLKRRLDESKRDMDRAKNEADRQAERKHQVERDTQLRGSVNANDFAASAMNANADRMRKQARADELTAAALKQSSTGGSDVEAIVNEALGSEQPKTNDPLAELAALNQKK